jgi:hypothetical protein
MVVGLIRGPTVPAARPAELPTAATRREPVIQESRAELVELLGQLRDADGWVERGRAFASGASTLSGLSADERRELAIDVSEVAAPQLRSELEAADFEGEPVAEALNTLRELDADDLDVVIEAIEAGTGEQQAQAAGAPGGSAEAETSRETTVTTEEEADTTDERADATHERADATHEGTDATHAETEGAREEPDATAVPTGGDRSATTREDPFGGAAPRQPTTGSRPAEDATPGRQVTKSAEETESPDLAARVRRADKPAACLGVISASLVEARQLSTAELVAAVEAVPDGWARRRALERLVAGGAVDGQAAAELVATLGGDADRRWVAATMTEAALLEAADLDGLIGPRAAGRLAQRYGNAHGLAERARHATRGAPADSEVPA